MNENNTRNSKSLTLQQTVELLGADKPRDMGIIHTDPIGLQALAARVSKRLCSRRGRPTDPSWNIARKIPMKQETWDSLGRVAAEMDPAVAAGQMGAIALEVGLRILSAQHHRRIEEEVAFVAAKLEIRDESWEEARQLCPTINEERFW